MVAAAWSPARQVRQLRGDDRPGEPRRGRLPEGPWAEDRARARRSERRQEREERSPVLIAQAVEPLTGLLRLDVMGLDGGARSERPSIVQEPGPGPQTPERRGPKLVRGGRALADIRAQAFRAPPGTSLPRSPHGAPCTEGSTKTRFVLPWTPCRP